MAGRLLAKNRIERKFNLKKMACIGTNPSVFLSSRSSMHYNQRLMQFGGCCVQAFKVDWNAELNNYLQCFFYQVTEEDIIPKLSKILRIKFYRLIIKKHLFITESDLNLYALFPLRLLD